MRLSFESFFHQLQYSAPIKGRQLLRELESNIDDLTYFCSQASRLNSSRAKVVCQLLSGTSAREYMDLLQAYALSEDDDLSNAALNTIEKVAPSSRHEILYALLNAPNEHVRLRVCKILGTDDNSGNMISTLLEDSSSNVIIAALSQISNNKLITTNKACERLLSHTDPEVRTAAIKTLFTLKTDFPAKKILRLLRSLTEDPIVRVTACTVLAGTVASDYESEFISILNSIAPTEVKVAAAKSLERCHTKSATTALFDICISRGHDQQLAFISQQSLLRMPSDLLINCCKDAFSSDSPQIRLEGGLIAGLLGNNDARNLILKQIKSEQNTMVLSGLLEEAGRCMIFEVWDIARDALNSSPLIAYSAAQTLSSLLRPEKIDDFCTILSEEHESSVYEVVLKRLASYARSHKLPANFSQSFSKFFADPYPNVAMLALECAAHIKDEPELVMQMIYLMHDTEDEQILTVLVKAIMDSVNNDTYRLLEITGNAFILEIANTLSRTKNIGENAENLFLKLAELAVEKVENAHLCLTIAAWISPHHLINALNTARNDQIPPLLTAWKNLVPKLRRSVSPPWHSLLQMPEPEIRLFSLQAMTTADALPLLAEITDLALLDPDEKVTEQAKILIRDCLDYESPRKDNDA